MGCLDGSGFIGVFAVKSLTNAIFVKSGCVCKLDV